MFGIKNFSDAYQIVSNGISNRFCLATSRVTGFFGQFVPRISKVAVSIINNTRNAIPCIYSKEFTLSDCQEGSPYWEFTRRLSSTEKSALQAKLESLQNVDVTIERLQDALRSDTTEPVFEIQDYVYYGILALRRGRLTKEQVGTIHLYWAAEQAHGRGYVRKMSLFDEYGQRNELAWKYLLSTFQHPAIHPSLFLINEQEFENFVRALPPSEQQFLYVVDSAGVAAKDFNPGEQTFREYLDSMTINFSIYHHTKTNNFGHFKTDSEESMRMIAPIGLRQAFLDATFGDQTTRLNIVLGLSSLEEFRKNANERSREMSVRSPACLLPNQADSLAAPWYEFTDHDFYHAFIASSIPSSHQQLFVECFDLIQEYRRGVLFYIACKVLDAVGNLFLGVIFYPLRSITWVIRAKSLNYQLCNSHHLLIPNSWAGLQVISESCIDMEHHVYRKLNREGYANEVGKDYSAISDEQIFWASLCNVKIHMDLRPDLPHLNGTVSKSLYTFLAVRLYKKYKGNKALFAGLFEAEKHQQEKLSIQLSQLPETMQTFLISQTPLHHLSSTVRRLMDAESE